MAKSKPNPRHLVEFAETDAIIGLLGHVARRTRKPPAVVERAPAPEPEHAPEPIPEPEPQVTIIEQEPAATFIVYEPPPPLPDMRLDPPPVFVAAPTEPERFETPVPMQSYAQSFSWDSTVEEKEPEAPTPVEAPSVRESPSVRETTSRETPRLVETTSREPVIDPNLVEQPVEALTLGEFFARMNWHNRPEAVQPMPLIGHPEPPRYEETVESVLNAFAWGDE